jgi:hypothetical protein
MSTPATVRHHVLTNLDHYLTELEEQLTAKGGKVVYLRSVEEVADSIELLAREKGWPLPADLRQQMERLEPGVAEYLLGGPREAGGSLLLAAGELRIASAAYLIAEAGAVCLIGPPADGAGPRMQIVVAGIDRVLPRMRDVAVFLPLLAGEGSVQFLTGPRRAGEWDGPEELYVYLVDGGRIPLLADPAKRDVLRPVWRLSVQPAGRKSRGLPGRDRPREHPWATAAGVAPGNKRVEVSALGVCDAKAAAL